MFKLLPWGLGAAAVLGLLFFASPSSAAVAKGGAPKQAPAAVITALGKAVYEEGDAGKAVSGLRLVYAFATEDPVAEPYTALGWVKAEIASGRKVFCTTSALDEITLSSAPLYSFAADKVPSYVTSETFFQVVP